MEQVDDCHRVRHSCRRAAERLFCTVGVHPTRCDEFDQHPEGPDGYMAQLTRIMEDGQSDGKARLSAIRLLGDPLCLAACEVI